MTLDVKTGPTILRMKEVLPSGLLLLEGRDGKECCCRQCSFIFV